MNYQTSLQDLWRGLMSSLYTCCCSRLASHLTISCRLRHNSVYTMCTRAWGKIHSEWSWCRMSRGYSSAGPERDHRNRSGDFHKVCTTQGRILLISAEIRQAGNSPEHVAHFWRRKVDVHFKDLKIVSASLFCVGQTFLFHQTMRWQFMRYRCWMCIYAQTYTYIHTMQKPFQGHSTLASPEEFPNVASCGGKDLVWAFSVYLEYARSDGTRTTAYELLLATCCINVYMESSLSLMIIDRTHGLILRLQYHGFMQKKASGSSKIPAACSGSQQKGKSY